MRIINLAHKITKKKSHIQVQHLNCVKKNSSRLQYSYFQIGI